MDIHEVTREKIREMVVNEVNSSTANILQEFDIPEDIGMKILIASTKMIATALATGKIARIIKKNIRKKNTSIALNKLITGFKDDYKIITDFQPNKLKSRNELIDFLKFVKKFKRKIKSGLKTVINMEMSEKEFIMLTGVPSIKGLANSEARMLLHQELINTLKSIDYELGELEKISWFRK